MGMDILIGAFGLGLIILLVWFLQVKAAKLVVTDNEILYEAGLLSKERSELNISRVTSVKVNQSFFNRMFGVGTIEVYTAGDKPEIVAVGMPEPNKVRDLVKARQNRGL